jgi:trehalose synthase-fused probable maltokinase
VARDAVAGRRAVTDGFTPSWLAARRWFRAKQRPIESVTEVDRAQLPGAVDLRVLEVTYTDGVDVDRYLVLAVEGREPLDGEGAWTALLTLIVDDAELRAVHGTFVANRTDAVDELLPSAQQVAGTLDERSLGVEQSNTSVVLGDRLILKLFRRLEPGESPDLEVGAFLTEIGYDDTPRLAGSIIYHPDTGDPSAVAMLQALVPNRGDAWAAVLDDLARDPSSATQRAAQIGRVTASMHRALASRPAQVAFPSRSASNEETASWRASAERQLAGAVAAVSGDERRRLAEIAPAITTRFADAFESATGTAVVSRIHGDYHLGQLLVRADGGYSIIDFEGEPARSLPERRAPSSPLRDVAGLLRSLDYAARTAERRSKLDAEEWLKQGRAAFVAGYGGVPPAMRALLDAFELEKACYEVRYEAGNRPAWLWLPLAAVERLVSG